MGHARGRRRRGALLAVVALVACVLPAVASAHAYLVGSDPPAGARLASSPPRIVLRFNEDFVPGSARVTLRKTDGTDVALPPPVARGSTIAQPLPGGLRGIFLLTWTLLSDDGHPTQGSVPFSVGASGALPAATASSGPTQWPEAAADWLFFAGLALAIGGILSERLVWRAPPVRAPVVFGIGVALGAGAVSLVLLAADRVHGSLVDGLDASALRDVSQSRPGALTVGMLALLLAAAALVVARRPLVALAPLAATSVLVAFRGHAGTSGDWWAPVADAVHLLAAAAWTGALAHLVLVLLAVPALRSADAVPVRRYAELALPTVLVVLATGVLTALAEFKSLSAVLETGYGQTLLVKSGLVAGALCFALASRLFALHRNPGIDVPLLRRLTLPELGLVSGGPRGRRAARQPRAAAQLFRRGHEPGPRTGAGPLRAVESEGDPDRSVRLGPGGRRPRGRLRCTPRRHRPGHRDGDGDRPERQRGQRPRRGRPSPVGGNGRDRRRLVRVGVLPGRRRRARSPA